MNNVQSQLIAQRDTAIADHYAVVDQFQSGVKSGDLVWGSAARSAIESKMTETRHAMGLACNLVQNYRPEDDAQFAAYITAGS